MLWSTWLNSRWIFIMHVCVYMFSPCIFFPEPIFVDAHVIPDGTDPNDAKIYFFFKEKLTDNSRTTKQIHSMIARICPVCINIVFFLIQFKQKPKKKFSHFFHP